MPGTKRIKRKSAARQRIAQTAKRASPIPIAGAGYSLAQLPGAENLPVWIPVVICVVYALLAVTDKTTIFLLRLAIIRGYREDYRRSDAGDYVEMFRELNKG
jgi:hypothetical protein